MVFHKGKTENKLHNRKDDKGKFSKYLVKEHFLGIFRIKFSINFKNKCIIFSSPYIDIY